MNVLFKNDIDSHFLKQYNGSNNIGGHNVHVSDWTHKMCHNFIYLTRGQYSH